MQHADSPVDTTLPERVVDLLKQQNARLVTAESCTGGMLSSLLVDVPGASDVFWGGFVTYSNEAKMKHLGVSADTLARHGAVSRETAREMAENPLRSGGLEGVLFSLSTTGVAGPGGGTPEKPVGTVWTACSRRDAAGGGATRTKVLRIDADRNGVRTRAAYAALALLRESLLGLPAGDGAPGVEESFWKAAE